jgi:acyl dehydratase
MQDNYKVGARATITRSFTQKDIELFAKLSTDLNPIHLDYDYAVNLGFPNVLVQGILVSGLFSALIANKLPGPGSVYIAQELNFRKPVYAGEQLIAEVEITNVREDKPIITLKTICYKDTGDIAVDGMAIVKKL